MISLSKHCSAENFKIGCILSLFLFGHMYVEAKPQSHSLGQGICQVFTDYARTHWESAENLELVLEHVSSYPKWKRKDLKESIIYLQSKDGYVYYLDSVSCHFEGDVCSFVLPKFVQPCELTSDISVGAFLKKIKIAAVCFNTKGQVVYSAQSVCERCVSKLQKEILKTRSQELAYDAIWVPLVVKKESASVQNFCTKESVDSDIQNQILLYVQTIWRCYPDVNEVRLCLFFP